MLENIYLKDYFLSLYETLKPEGRVGFLCLTRPKNPLVKILYYPYLKFYLPLVGRLISKNKEAYQFLSQSVEIFQLPKDTEEMLYEAGFSKVIQKPFAFGAATLIVGFK